VITSPKVLVVISTYNGTRYLEELLVSVENQRAVDVSLLIRDDGSSDATLQLLSSRSFSCDTKIIIGENLGYSKSYFDLMRIATDFDFEYLSFCDQDDVWMPDKLIRAVRQLEATGKSHYSSKRMMFKDQKFNSTAYPKLEVDTSFEKTVFENVSAGCTVVLTNSHVLELLRLGCSEIGGDYDHIIHVMSSAMNASCFDQESRIYYRLHEGNALGVGNKSRRTVESIYKQIKVKAEILETLLSKLGPKMSTSNYLFATDLFRRRNFVKRLIWVFRIPKLRQKTHEDFILKLILLCKGLQS
jgi:glycosyltransferase involved in cell wall biosynthesis